MPHLSAPTQACPAPVPPPGSRGIDEILAAARSRLRRLDPEEAHLAYRGGALLVDIRPAAQRAAHGTVPGALAVERNVLEWRFDPRCPSRLPEAVDYDLRVVILCQEGYTSSLAAAALQDLGLHHATDVVGGFAAWRITGLPTLGPTPPLRPSPVAPPVTAGSARH
ncbi:rhodanese-like domain-containing protein [Micromonospora olivasterospora]|uniref:Rhodanese-related sulfurtransferase n=1 Tax=Micromonospora olivasterospora TaxID=1880 RepID=A0A562IFL7_MICOL|nr:rhodanese-like domain-containing protein [Micromonospora olivasterospora]TWH69616.1 rhodanese-related sulfurtransferase [Micromonospora olivasterospora]